MVVAAQSAARKSAGAAVRIGPHTLKLSNLSKVLYPATGATKAEVIDYYARIAPFMLPHLRNRPVTLKRYPDGVDGPFFYGKNCPAHRPDWIETGKVRRQSRNDWIFYCLLNSKAALIWTANLAALELHTFLHRADDLEHPTMITFDLDPGPPAGLRDCARMALLLRDILAQRKLRGFIKASGGKGLHFYLPLNTKVTYDATGSFARSLATLLEREEPKKVTSNMRKELRGGKVFIDWSQNSQHKTTACVYTLRARQKPSTSMPLHWEEVEELAASRAGRDLIDTSLQRTIERAETEGDIFKAVLTIRQRLPDVD